MAEAQKQEGNYGRSYFEEQIFQGGDSFYVIDTALQRICVYLRSNFYFRLLNRHKKQRIRKKMNS